MAGRDLPAAPTLAPDAGNLTAHLRKLEDAGYLVGTREFQDSKPCNLATGDAGRQDFAEYVANIRRALSLPAGGVAGGCVARCLNRSEAPSEGCAIG